jgi:signal peptidase I
MPLVRAALERDQRVRLTVTGSSMLPFLRDNDVVELEPAPVLRFGDMVLVQRVESSEVARYVLHRIVRVEGVALHIRGDAQSSSEAPFGPDAVLGRVSTLWRHGRVRRMNGGLWRLAGVTWALMSPLGPYLLQLALPVWRRGRRVQQGRQRK